MSLWCIENLDDAGEGMFIVNARSKEEALKVHAERNARLEVTSCERIKWVDLALVTGGIEVQDWGEGPYKYRVALKVVGSAPRREAGQPRKGK
jgi:hypothetical protein